MTESTDLPPATTPPTTPPATPRTAPPGASSTGWSPPPQAPRPDGFQQLWGALRRTGVRRPADDRWLAGVCSGTARRLGVDPVLLRVVLIALVLLGGFGVVVYAAAMVLLPDHDGRIELERASLGDLTGTTVGAVALVLLGIIVPGPLDLVLGRDLVNGGELVGALVVGTVLLVGLALLPSLREAVERSAATRGPATPGTYPAAPSTGPATTYGAPTYGPSPSYGSTAAYGSSPAYGAPGYGASSTYGTGSPAGASAYAWTPRPPRPVRPARKGPGPAVSAAATGGALVAAGGAWLATQYDLLEGRPGVVAACAALAVLGAVLVGLGIAGRRDGGVGFTTLLVLLAVAALLLVPSWRTTQLVGERTWTPLTETEAGRGGTVGLGDGVLDLTALEDLPAGAAVDVPVRVGIGELTVLVPEGMDVTVRAGALVGSTVAAVGGDVGDETGGVGVSRTLQRATDPQVVVDARVLIGTVRLEEVAP